MVEAVQARKEAEDARDKAVELKEKAAEDMITAKLAQTKAENDLEKEQAKLTECDVSQIKCLSEKNEALNDAST